MLKRPSSRRKTGHSQIELNLIPILDTMVTLIGFLLFTTSFLVMVHIESILPQSSTQEIQEKLKEKPLQLTVTLNDKETLIWSPFRKIDPITIQHGQSAQPNIKAIHEALVEVKKKFPQEASVVVVPTVGTNYDVLMSLMDSLRILEPSDPSIYVKNEKTGIDEPTKALFPKIVFGNLLGDS